MLTETIVAAISTLPTSKSSKAVTPAPAIRDAAIITYDINPHASPRQTIKKSSVASNCVAVTGAHIFAAQADKSVVNVYGRENGKQEASVPFREQARSLQVTCDGGVVCLGFEGGGIGLWEVASGRFVQTSPAHLAPITSMAISPDSQSLISGSSDTTALVWSIPSLLSFTHFPHPTLKSDSAHPFGDSSSSNQKSPVHTLSHNASISCLSAGNIPTSAGSGIVAVGTEDGTLRIWDYGNGQLLRIFLLGEASVPRALSIDMADRGVYLGYDDGSVQLVDFYALISASENSTQSKIKNASLLDGGATATPIQTARGDSGAVWKSSKGEEAGSVLSIALSFDGTTLLSGHENGTVHAWDTGSRTFKSELLALSGAVTNLHFLPIEGLRGPSTEQAEGRARIKLAKIVKPIFATMGETHQAPGTGEVPGTYQINARFVGDISDSGPGRRKRRRGEEDEFGAVLECSNGWPNDFLEANLAEFTSSRTQSNTGSMPAKVAPSSAAGNEQAMAESSNYMALEIGEDSGQGSESVDAKNAKASGRKSEHTKLSLEQQNERLRQRIEALQSAQRVSFRQIKDLRVERERYLGIAGTETRQHAGPETKTAESNMSNQRRVAAADQMDLTGSAEEYVGELEEAGSEGHSDGTDDRGSDGSTVDINTG